MTDVLFGFLLNLLLFSAIGAGPCLWLFSGPRRLAFATAAFPAAGFTLTALAGTYLTLLDYSVARWTAPWIVLSMVMSFVLAVAFLLRNRLSLRRPRTIRWLVLSLASFILSIGLSLAPQLLGGLRYSILRGNGIDSFNYVIMAGYLDHEPYSWVSRADPQALVDRHPAYERARHLLITRWTTSALLAFTSRVARVPIYRFEYAFSALSFTLAYSLILIYARVLLKLRPIYAIGAALAVCNGFWPQLILDLRADSQQNSVPVLLLLALIAADMEDRRRPSTPWGQHIFVALTALALLFLYPEITPMAVFAVALFLGTYLPGTRKNLPKRLAMYGVSLFLVLAGAAPLSQFVARFIKGQMTYAVGGQNTWHIAYFQWLYFDPFTGIWGFGPLVTPIAARAAFLAPAAILSATLAVSVLRALRPGAKVNAGRALAASFTLTAFLQWIYLVIRGQLWAGAKGLSFGYPFLTLALLGYIFAPRPPIRNRLRLGAAACASFWLCVQCGLALYRPWLAFRNEEYVNYIDGNAEYKRHDWNLDAFTRAIRKYPGATVWANSSIPVLSDYLSLVLGWDIHLINIGARDIADSHVPRQTVSQWPQFLIQDNGAVAALASRQIVARTAELSLLHWPEDTPLWMVSIENPNGVEANNPTSFFWMGGQATTFTLISAANGCAAFHARFTLGPSRPDLEYRDLLVNSSAATALPQRIVLNEGVQEFRAPVSKGMTRISVLVEDRPTVYLATDKRPLMLQVADLDVTAAPCRPSAGGA